MNRAILTYAKSFENYEPFKAEMELGQLHINIGGAELNADYRRHARLCLQNPFIEGSITHPVEAGLLAANAASTSFLNIEEFKQQRAMVVA